MGWKWLNRPPLKSSWIAKLQDRCWRRANRLVQLYVMISDSVSVNSKPLSPTPQPLSHRLAFFKMMPWVELGVNLHFNENI